MQDWTFLKSASTPQAHLGWLSVDFCFFTTERHLQGESHAEDLIIASRLETNKADDYVSAITIILSFWNHSSKKKKKKIQIQHLQHDRTWDDAINSHLWVGQDSHLSKSKTFVIQHRVQRASKDPLSVQSVSPLKWLKWETETLWTRPTFFSEMGIRAHHNSTICVYIFFRKPIKSASSPQKQLSVCTRIVILLSSDLTWWSKSLFSATFVCVVITKPPRVRSQECKEALQEYFKLMDWNKPRGRAWMVWSRLPSLHIMSTLMWTQFH